MATWADVASAAEPVLRDLRAAGIDDVVLVDHLDHAGLTDWQRRVLGDWADSTEDVEVHAWVTRRGETSASGICVWTTDPPPHHVAVIADAVQEHVIEHGDNTFPTCPTHGTHPLWVDEPDGETWPSWRCRTDPTIAFPVGDLPAS